VLEVLRDLQLEESEYTSENTVQIYKRYGIENIRQPKILEAGKYFAGGEFTLTKDSVHPLKTYESFEADPMDSILSAFSNISRDEKV